MRERSESHPEPLVHDSVSSHTGPRLVYFAAERTLLSWIHTALGLMAFGFVVDRFGLFLYHYAPERPARFDPEAYSLWMGVFLVITGMVMSAAAAIRYLRFIARYRKTENTDPGRGLSLAVGFAVLVALAVSGVIVFLITVIR